MRPSRALCTLALLLVLGAGAGRSATPAPLPGESSRGTADLDFDALYTLALGGFDVAELVLRHTASDSTYSGALSVKVIGLASYLTDYTARFSSRGIVADGELRPEIYKDLQASSRVRTRIDARYDPVRKTATRVMATKRGEPRTQKVPRRLWQGAVDPLTAFLDARRAILLGDLDTEGDSQVFPVFDGRRRYDLTLTLLGPGRRTVEGERVRTIRAELQLDPIAGFDEEEEGAKPAKLIGEYTADGLALPLTVRAQNVPIAVIFRFERLCTRDAPCTTPPPPAAG